jgi:dCTP deaminase
MSLLSYNRLVQLVEQGIITNVKPEQINSTSIDITLGEKLLVEVAFHNMQKVSLKKRNNLNMDNFDFSENRTFQLYPGQFILAQSQQVFHLPNNISAEYKLKSSMARIGLEHMNAGWCDAGWNNSVLTLEFKNMTRHHIIELNKGDAIGQVVFFEHEPVPYERSYATRGRYNGDHAVQGIKP